jgi:hypothetical protein
MFCKHKIFSLKDAIEYFERDAVIAKSEQKAVARSFARLFSTEDGKRVLSYLQHITCNRAMPSMVDEAQLRYTEGQRSVVKIITTLIERGKSE